MKIGDFDLYKDLLEEKSGLMLTPDKSYLLDSRLTPLSKKWGFPSLEAMTLELRGLPDAKLIKDIVEAMTTNETSFFRDLKPFDLMKTIVLPHLAKTRSAHSKIRIWCAASSTGQEPYSLAMMLREENTGISANRVEILATDICDRVLEQARNGLFTQFEVQRGLPVQYLMKYFKQIGEKWQLSDEIRKAVQYRNFNLLDNMATLGSFDIVFCRNVLIYFDDKKKAAVLEGISKQLPSDGFLFLGGAETVIGITDRFKPMEGQRGLYVLDSGNRNAVNRAVV